MTVQQLIEKLNKVEDKSKEIICEVEVEQSPDLTVSTVFENIKTFRIILNEPEHNNY